MFHFELFVFCVFMKNMMGFFRPERLKANSILRKAPKILLLQFHNFSFQIVIILIKQNMKFCLIFKVEFSLHSLQSSARK